MRDARIWLSLDTSDDVWLHLIAPSGLSGLLNIGGLNDRLKNGVINTVIRELAAHNEPGHVWKVCVTDERVPTARQVVAKLVTAMRSMGELAGMSDEQLSNFVLGATGMTVIFTKGVAWVRLGDPIPHKWKAGDKFTMPDSAHPTRVYRVHRVKGRTVWHLSDAHGHGDLPRGALSRAGPDRTKTWRLYEGK